MAKRTRTQRQTPVTVTTDTATTEARTIPHLDLAAEAILDGWTREHVNAALISRVKRDQGYLAYRKACNRRTSYDSHAQCGIRSDSWRPTTQHAP
jgi:hypothetical protein